MHRLARQVEFWVMVLAWVFHSLSATMWTTFGFVNWGIGMVLIWALYLCARVEAGAARELAKRLSERIHRGTAH